MIRKVTAAVLVGLTFVFTQFGCLEEAPSDPEEDEIVDPLDEEFTVTVVDLDLGGVVVAEYTETLRMQLSDQVTEGLGQASSELTVAGLVTCTNLFGTRLYENTNYTGTSICFVGSGNVDLQTLGWNARVESMRIGATGTFVQWNTSTLYACCQGCNARTADDSNMTADCEANKRYFSRNSCTAC
jgi:hypothetical protein